MYTDDMNSSREFENKCLDPLLQELDNILAKWVHKPFPVIKFDDGTVMGFIEVDNGKKNNSCEGLSIPLLLLRITLSRM